MPALAPRLDVVALHLVIFKMLTADGAYSVLLAVCRHFIPFIELPQIEKPAGERIRVAAKQKFVDTLRLLHLVVLVQTLYLRTYRGGVIDIFSFLNVIITTIDSITAARYNHRRNGCNTTNKIGGRADMELIISQMRWPAEVYRQIKERAYLERKSVNKMVVELVLKGLAS